MTLLTADNNIDYSQFHDEIDELLRENKFVVRAAETFIERHPELLQYAKAESIKRRLYELSRKGIVGPERLVVTKEVQNAEGETTKTVLSRRAENEVDTSGMVIKKVTKLYHGGNNIQYVADINWNTVIDRLKEELSDIQIPTIKRVKSGFQKQCAIVNIYDAHLDKLPVRPSSGVGSLEENIEFIDHKFDMILADIERMSPKKIIFPVGSDLFHTNFFNNKTKKGTELEYYCNPEIAYAKICKWVVEKILQLSAFTKELVVIPIRGNHDEDKVLTMKVWLDLLFKESESIRVINNIPLNARVYESFGRNLFGFAHGDKEKKFTGKLPVMMSLDEPELWAKSERRQFYLGDLHHEFEWRFQNSKEHAGVKVEFLRSAGVDDNYHISNGWIGVPKMIYMDVWPENKGRKYRVEYEL